MRLTKDCLQCSWTSFSIRLPSVPSPFCGVDLADDAENLELGNGAERDWWRVRFKCLSWRLLPGRCNSASNSLGYEGVKPTGCGLIIPSGRHRSYCRSAVLSCEDTPILQMGQSPSRIKTYPRWIRMGGYTYSSTIRYPSKPRQTQMKSCKVHFSRCCEFISGPEPPTGHGCNFCSGMKIAQQ